MNKLDAFKKLIREEVKKAVREELKNFLIESETKVIKPKQTVIENRTKESFKPKFTKPQVYSNDPIKQLLSETAFNMDASEYKTMMSADSSMAQGFPQMLMQERESFSPVSQPQVVESVSEMLASTRPANDINQVEIDTVPDFSDLMQTLKAKGQI